MHNILLVTCGVREKLVAVPNGMKISDKIFILEAPLSFLVWVYLAVRIP